jgi:hypothetical protein
MAALEDLCRTIPDPDMVATGLEALFEFDPSAAGAIAEERLRTSLDARCVPGKLVSLMATRGPDPFRAVGERLDSLGCDRRALRPDDAVSLSENPDDPSVRAAQNAAERMSGACRRSFEELLGLGAKEAANGSEE